MPYVETWEPPALYLAHRGVHVYHEYRADDGQVLDHHFTMDPEEAGEYSFDVRELPAWKRLKHIVDEEVRAKMVIREAIEQGLLVEPEGVQHPVPLQADRCPRCESTVSITWHDLEFHGPRITQGATCNECGHGWVNQYDMTAQYVTEQGTRPRV